MAKRARRRRSYVSGFEDDIPTAKNGHKVIVSNPLFRKALQEAEYEYWIPWKDAHKIGDCAYLVERYSMAQVEMVCLDIVPTKDGFWTAKWGLTCGVLKL